MGMKLRKFRIQNYKSIRDTGYCRLASDLTVLAGKNESGKTAILEALRDFDTSVKGIARSALPLEKGVEEGNEPCVELCFDVSKSTLNQIAEAGGVTLGQEAREHIEKDGLTIFKDREATYSLADETTELIEKQVHDQNRECIGRIESAIEDLKRREQFSGMPEPDLGSDLETIRLSIGEFLTQARSLLASVSNEGKKEQATKLIDLINEERGQLATDDVASAFLHHATQYLPHMIFFSDFSDILPFEIPLADAVNHQTVRDFAKVAGLDLEEVVRATDSQRRRNILKDHSAIITGDFSDYYGQDRLELLAEPDGDKIRFGVQEFGKTTLYKIEQRSKGLQWFLSFYLRLSAETAENKMILVDEPGLYVHAKAQKDILTILEKEIATKSQVIFSTHSPYLIEADRLDRVRLVVKESEGTRITNIQKDADTDTLTPIVTAIGLDLSNVFSIAGRTNVLLEGISDYFYMQAMREFIPRSQRYADVRLVGCVGAQNIPTYVSLLHGWELEFAVVLDTDREGEKVKQKLLKKLQVQESRIVPISDTKAVSIEDLFTRRDFNAFLLRDDIKNDEPEVSNSKFLKRERIAKEPLARQFFEKVKQGKSQVQLCKETVDNFSRLFEKVSEAFKSS